MNYFLSSLRLWLVTILVCVVGYAMLMFGFAQATSPYAANGSIIEVDGRAVGSELVGQNFASPRYFWLRPSAAEYDGMAGAGSNLSPTSEKLKARAAETIMRYGATVDNPLPADLVAASGGGLDPHISLAGALYQTERVAAARKMSEDKIRKLTYEAAVSPGGATTPHRIVNVLQLNLALDRLQK